MENAKLFLSQKSQFDLVEEIKNKNKNRTRASLFQSSEGGKQENVYMALSFTTNTEDCGKECEAFFHIKNY